MINIDSLIGCRVGIAGVIGRGWRVSERDTRRDGRRREQESIEVAFMENGVRVWAHARGGDTAGPRARAAEKTLAEKDSCVGEGLRQGC